MRLHLLPHETALNSDHLIHPEPANPLLRRSSLTQNSRPHLRLVSCSESWGALAGTVLFWRELKTGLNRMTFFF